MLSMQQYIHYWSITMLVVASAAAQPLVSDDFSTSRLNTALWTVVDPLGDGSYRMTGTQLALTVPAGDHSITTAANRSLRAMQSIANADFTAEVKFESALSSRPNKVVIQGMLVQQSTTQFLRFDFESDVKSTRLYVGYFNGATQTTKILKTLYGSPTQPLYMRVQRSGSTWIVTHGTDGATWTNDGSFSQAMTVAQTGPFVSNEGSGAPAFTAIVDYFFNAASPISPEDTHTLAIVTTGSGSVTPSPELTNYPAATTVTLAAAPVACWGFDHWTRDLTGAKNPGKVFMDDNKTVEAVFTQVISNLSATTTSRTATIAWTTSKTVTSRIDYGLTASYGSAANDPSTGTSHSVTLSGLAPGTTYHYRVTSTDINGNAAQSGDGTFATAPEYALTINVTGQGSVTRAPDQEGYVQGTSVTLTATPAAGYHFSGWSGALGGSVNPASVTITTGTVVGARFDEFVITPGAVNLTTNSAQISWTTNFPSTGRVEFGLTSTYELGQAGSNQPGLQHTVTITGIDTSVTHHYRIVAHDEGAAETATGDLTFVLQSGAIVSDDFSHTALDPAVWAFINPLGDGSYSLNGTQLLISVPDGTNHDLWTGGIDAPRVMQAVADADFGLEVKFESLPASRFQMQGILVEQDATHHLRFEFYHDGTRLYAYAAYITDASAASRIQLAVTGTNPMWMRITRVGDDWLMEYSADGSAWTPAGLFTQAFTMTAIGPYAGNYGGPAWTTVVDYFFNEDSPIIPEDGAGFSLTTIVSGQGAVVRAPNKAIYAAGETVSIEAVADPSWRFKEWTDDTTGTLNPASITMTRDWIVTGNFEQFIIDPHASAMENSAVISWTTPVPAGGRVEYGLTQSYGAMVESAELSTSHALTIAGLSGNTLYHYRITSADAAGNPTSSGDMTFTTGAPSNIVSDDFFGTTTMPVWTFVNPGGAGSLAMTGTQARITVAAGAHELWTTGMNAPRLEQPAADTNFEIEAAFESIIAAAYQEQGIFVEESETRFIRIEFYHDGFAPHFMVTTIQNGTYNFQYDQIVASAMPQRVRVKRSGDTWTMWYQTGTSDWIQAVAFNYAMIVTKVGPYAGTYGPAHTVLVDYFFNADSPITPEDNGLFALVVNVAGNGTVTKNPDRVAYDAGDVVQLTAVPNDASAVFSGWSGALTGNQNPAQVTIQGDTVVTANFASSGDTTIVMWHGDSQQFGQNGKPQVWVDLLGTVNDGDGLQSLTASLNGGAQMPLTIGPDGRRLQGAGDFDVQLAYDDLEPGNNTIVLRAVDTLNHVTTKTVTVNYVDGVILGTELDVNWASVARVQDASQVVDGRWSLAAAGAKNDSIGYDRLIDIGDMNWTDYEITVPITVHSWDPAGVGGINGYPGAGFIIRWNGHTNDPPVATQPLSGWNPFGNCVWYRWDDTGGHSNTFELGNLNDNTGVVLQYNVTYIYKVRVETIPGVGTLYSKKVWKQGDLEPAEWTKQAYGATDVAHGSILFIAHWVQMTVGNITVRPTDAPFNSITVNAQTDRATIRWQTAVPRTSVVNYGLTALYELGSVSDDALTTSHSLTITGLAPGTLYHYRLSGVNAGGYNSSSGDMTFTTASPQTIRSDNFNTTTLNTAVWTFVDPVGDSTLAMTGAEARISLPAKSDHDAWTSGNRAARLLQTSADTDFQIEAKFNSSLDLTYQFHGLIVEQDASHYLRFDVVRMGGTTNAFSSWLSGSSASNKVNKAIDGSPPLYLRVTRAGTTWAYDYSHDGSTWTRIVSFTQAMTVTKVGVLVGNAEGTSSPAFTGRIDYFNNTASPEQN
ncbi:DUF1349 domain-containing protein [bacterium]|nr:DUF1349 domain-containing protein [bacterium]